MDYSGMEAVVRAVKDVWGLTALMVLVVGIIVRVLFRGAQTPSWVRLAAFAMMLLGFFGFLRVVMMEKTRTETAAAAPAASLAFRASSDCPDTSFAYLGRLGGEALQGQPAFRQRQDVRIPEQLVLDGSYHQPSVTAAGGGATSPLQASQIPPGIFIKVDGGHYWAAFDPKLDGRVFSIDIYCGPEPPPGSGCNIKVDVCAKWKLGEKL
jgi:hypothetical protein